MTKKRIIRALAIVLALLMPVLTAVVAFAGVEQSVNSNAATNSKYESPNVNSLTGHGEEPEELSVTSGAKYQEKAWYEYVMYSDHAISSYRVDDQHRILFYDPYTYTNSLIMDVQNDSATTEFDTMSEYSISHTTSKTISACVESTYTNTSSTQTSGRDLTHSEVKNTGETKTIYNHSINNETSGTVTEEKGYEYIMKDTEYTERTLGGQIESKVTMLDSGISTVVIENNNYKHDIAWLTDKETNTTKYSPDYKTSTKYTGDDTIEYNTTSTTEGWTELSARITKTVGSSSSTSSSWAETEGTTVTKKYAATHFASDGVTPLPWAIVHYTVQMPMKCCYQVFYSGEWVTITTVYCLLTTIKGTCRSWMQNGQVYYEDWGNGEPVVATDFWGQFMTKDQLMQAYNDKLYPTGGEN